MADVYEAEDTVIGRRVALKLLPPEFARDPERVARFMKEVRNSASLQHPNIVPIYDVGEGDGFHFYTMQLLEAGDLKERIKAGMPPGDAVAVLKYMAAALGAAHLKGIVHRDVKPENVMFDGGGRAILTDLGIARVAAAGTRMTKTGMSIGTPHYMSPEQIRGQDVDGRSDIYSLGIMFHEMLTGKVPYDAEETLAVSYKHVNDPIPVLPAQFAAYQPMLNGMLGKDPGQRYPDCAALLCDAQRVERGERAQGVSCAPDGAAPRDAAVPPAKGAGVKAAMIGALAALLVAGGAFWFFNQGRPVAARGGGSGGSSLPAHDGSASVAGPKTKASGAPSLAALADVLSSSGVLELSSDPSGAVVFLDGKRKGKTPLTLREVRAGTHDVELRLAEHEAKHFPVSMAADKTVSRHVRMSYDPELMRSLTVRAEPADATVKILNIKPRYKPGISLRSGKYKVQVSKEGFSPKTVWVEIAEKDVVLPVRLEVAESAGRRTIKEEWSRAVRSNQNKNENQSNVDDEMKKKIFESWRKK